MNPLFRALVVSSLWVAVAGCNRAVVAGHANAPLPPAPQFERLSVREMQTGDSPPTAVIAQPIPPRKIEIKSELQTSGELESIDAALEKDLGDPFGDDPETAE